MREREHPLKRVKASERGRERERERGKEKGKRENEKCNFHNRFLRRAAEEVKSIRSINFM